MGVGGGGYGDPPTGGPSMYSVCLSCEPVSRGTPPVFFIAVQVVPPPPPSLRALGWCHTGARPASALEGQRVHVMGHVPMYRCRGSLDPGNRAAACVAMQRTSAAAGSGAINDYRTSLMRVCVVVSSAPHNIAAGRDSQAAWQPRSLTIALLPMRSISCTCGRAGLCACVRRPTGYLQPPAHIIGHHCHEPTDSCVQAQQRQT